ncbi:hypothetical protein AN218_27115 [Streptomyces nanshensis]|uniref:OmpR/PhoB-type domain-containing protein n=1 Tax=Streptomyces nanshensis TaxID=518642 RepID=A0A1E7KWM9_9ACTN|nr:hypothetical protein AN218_27115 [Streptomyces nanshensis]
MFGAVRAWRGEVRLELGPARQRAVLAVLLLHANRPVERQRLIEAVWGDPPPAYAVNQLQKYVSALRRVLEPGREARSPSSVLGWTDGGYVLRVADDGLDLTVFEHRVGRGREALARGDTRRAAAELREALAVGSGPALGDVSSAALDGERDRLAESRAAALEDRITADLDLGHHGRLIPELTQLVAEFPLREHLAALLMLALFRAGRQSESLAVYDTARGVLAEELGVDPGPELRQRHRQILTGDAALSLDADRDVSPAAAQPRPVPRQLPAPPALFAGRDDELARLSAALAPGSGAGGVVVIAAVGGTGGIGKTCLALRWAHEHRDRFPDGELYVNLRGFDPSGPPVPPAVALRGFLEALGVDPAAVPDDPDARAGLYRTLAEGRRMLVVLDDARGTDHVRALIPGSGTCTVLVTSRSELAGLVTEFAAGSVSMDVLGDDEARDVLTRRLGEERITAEPQAAAAIVRRCAGLPLALSITAARAATRPHLRLAALADELAESAGRLDALYAGEVTADLRAVFAASYDALEPEAARAFALLGLAPGPDIGAPAAASLLAAPLSRTRSLLRGLEAVHLVREHAPDRYQFHDLVRLFAEECARRDLRETARLAALRRLADFLLHSAHHALCRLPARPQVLKLVPAPPAEGCTPHRCADAAAAREWFAAEDACLDAVHRTVRDLGWDTHVWQLPVVVLTFRSLHGRRLDGLDTMDTWQAAMEAADRLGDPAARALTRNATGTACAHLGRYARAEAHLAAALPLFEETGDLVGQADTLHMLGCCQEQQGAPHRALPYHERALPLYQAAGDTRWEANCRNSTGWCHALLGHYDRARRYCEDALTLARGAGDRIHEAHVLDSLGYIDHQCGQYSGAVENYRRARALFRESDCSSAEADTLLHLGDAYLALGRCEASRQAWHEALALHRARHRTAETRLLRERLDALDRRPAAAT